MLHKMMTVTKDNSEYPIYWDFVSHQALIDISEKPNIQILDPIDSIYTDELVLSGENPDYFPYMEPLAVFKMIPRSFVRDFLAYYRELLVKSLQHSFLVHDASEIDRTQIGTIECNDTITRFKIKDQILRNYYIRLSDKIAVRIDFPDPKENQELQIDEETKIKTPNFGIMKVSCQASLLIYDSTIPFPIIDSVINFCRYLIAYIVECVFATENGPVNLSVRSEMIPITKFISKEVIEICNLYPIEIGAKYE